MTKPVPILLPDESGAASIATLPGVLPLYYGDDDVLPPGGEVAEVLVAPDRAPSGAISMMSRLPQLRLVQTMNAGVEPWLPHVPANVLLSNARGAHGGATAEWAAAALLALTRDLPLYVRQQDRHVWSSRLGGTLMGSTVVVLGAGDLGTELRRRLEPFGSQVVLVGRTGRGDVRGIAELPVLLATAHALVIMVPLDDSTRGLVDARFLAQLPDGCIVVNAARGAIIDPDALLAELRSGRLRAALDVTDPEPLPSDDQLWDAPGLLLTPHVGGFAPGRAERVWAVVEQQLRQYLAGRNPDNTVNRSQLT